MYIIIRDTYTLPDIIYITNRDISKCTDQCDKSNVDILDVVLCELAMTVLETPALFYGL